MQTDDNVIASLPLPHPLPSSTFARNGCDDGGARNGCDDGGARNGCDDGGARNGCDDGGARNGCDDGGARNGCDGGGASKITRVVIESPYQGNIERNVEYALRAMRDCLARNEAPFASHLLYTHVPRVGFVDDYDERYQYIDREHGIRAGLAWAEQADKTVVYTDYGISAGMKWGIEHARQFGRCIEYREIGPNPTQNITRGSGNQSSQ